jgi:hypothetical protein
MICIDTNWEITRKIGRIKKEMVSSQPSEGTPSVLSRENGQNDDVRYYTKFDSQTTRNLPSL